MHLPRARWKPKGRERYFSPATHQRHGGHKLDEAVCRGGGEHGVGGDAQVQVLALQQPGGSRGGAGRGREGGAGSRGRAERDGAAWQRCTGISLLREEQ